MGAICQNSISEKNREMTNKEWIDFLEARLDDPKTEINEGKGPALCASSQDFAKVKTVIEQLCEAKKSQCKMEEVKQVFRRMDKLQRR
jgi:hypothetical protein